MLTEVRQNQPTRVWWLRRFRWMSLSSDGRLSTWTVTHVTLSHGLHRWNWLHFHNAKCTCVPYAWLGVFQWSVCTVDVSGGDLMLHKMGKRWIRWGESRGEEKHLGRQCTEGQGAWLDLDSDSFYKCVTSQLFYCSKSRWTWNIICEHFHSRLGSYLQRQIRASGPGTATHNQQLCVVLWSSVIFWRFLVLNSVQTLSSLQSSQPFFLAASPKKRANPKTNKCHEANTYSMYSSLHLENTYH